MNGRKVKDETGNVVKDVKGNDWMDEVNELVLQEGWLGGITTNRGFRRKPRVAFHAVGEGIKRRVAEILPVEKRTSKPTANSTTKSTPSSGLKRIN